jgi:hypothetical protein
MSKSKVEEQKGPIKAAQETRRHMTYPEKVREQMAENALRRSGQTLTLHEPKTSRK